MTFELAFILILDRLPNWWIFLFVIFTNLDVGKRRP